MQIDIGCGVQGRQQGHVVERREQDAPVHRVQMHEGVELVVDRGGRFGSGSGRWAEPVLGPASEPLYVPRQAVLGDDLGHALLPSLGQGDHHGEVRGQQRRRQRRAHRGEGEGVAGERAADARHVDLRVGHDRREALGDIRAHAVRRRRHAAADRLADDEQIGPQAPRLCRPAGTGTDRVGLVDHEQRACAIAQLAQRLVVAGVGQHDADVGERRLGEHTRNVAGRERGLEGGEVVELHDLRSERGVDGRADRAVAHDDGAGRVERGERLVDRAVVAPVEHEHLGAPGDLAGEAEHEAVGVGGGHRHLPIWQAEAPGELATDPGGVVVRQHRRDTSAGLGGERVGHLRQPMPGHRAGVAEAEVDVVMPVDIGEAGPVGFGEEEGERAWPTRHPGHRDTADEMPAGHLGPRRRGGVRTHEAVLFSGVQCGEAAAIDERGHGHHLSGTVASMSSESLVHHAGHELFACRPPRLADCRDRCSPGAPARSW